MAYENDTVERNLGRIASRAHGVVARRELLDAGVSLDEIYHRLEIGSLIRVHRGVYRVGHRAPSVEARYMAAVKACGEGARLRGLAAAWLFALIKGLAPPPEVSAVGRRRVRGVKTTRAGEVDATTYRGIPVASVPHTLVDIAADLSEYELAKACHEAGVRFGTTPRHVKQALRQRPRAKGAAKLRRIVDGDSPVLLSRMERRFRRLLRQARLPLPDTNRPEDGHYVDCRWPEQKLTVELDSYRFHSSRYAWEESYRRQREAYVRGDEFRHYCWSDVFETPAATVEEVGKALGRVEAWTQEPSR